MFLKWTELGIPEGYVSPRLVYNPPTETLIVEVSPNNDASLGNRILRRKLNEPNYSLIGAQAPPHSYENPITSNRSPLLFFNVMRMQRLEGPEGGIGGDWEGVYRSDLSNPSEPPVLVVAESSLALSIPYDYCWISKLISVLDEGTRLHVVAGLSENGGRTVDYHLAVLNLETREIQPLSLLRATFF